VGGGCAGLEGLGGDKCLESPRLGVWEVATMFIFLKSGFSVSRMLV